MRPNVNLLAFVGALLLGGCLHPTETPRPPVDPVTANERPDTTTRLLHIYVDCALPSDSPERNRALAESVALTLRDQLRLRGYDVRGAESIIRHGSAVTPPGEAIAQLCHLVRTVAGGTPPPAANRYATYLHPNAPRLLLFASLLPSATTASGHEAELRLGGLLADSATGDILWSGRTSSSTNGDDQGVRRLVAKLLVNFDPRPPQ